MYDNNETIFTCIRLCSKVMTQTFAIEIITRINVVLLSFLFVFCVNWKNKSLKKTHRHLTFEFLFANMQNVFYVILYVFFYSICFFFWKLKLNSWCSWFQVVILFDMHFFCVFCFSMLTLNSWRIIWNRHFIWYVFIFLNEFEIFVDTFCLTQNVFIEFFLFVFQFRKSIDMFDFSCYFMTFKINFDAIVIFFAIDFFFNHDKIWNTWSSTWQFLFQNTKTTLTFFATSLIFCKITKRKLFVETISKQYRLMFSLHQFHEKFVNVHKWQRHFSSQYFFFHFRISFNLLLNQVTIISRHHQTIFSSKKHDEVKMLLKTSMSQMFA